MFYFDKIFDLLTKLCYNDIDLFIWGDMMRKWGDRYDAKRVRDIDGLHFYMAYLMPKRTDAEVYINEKIDITELLKYIEEKNMSGERKVTLFHCVIAVVARTVKMRPLLNRYISGKRYYMRNEISMGFTIKKKFTDHSEETLMIYRPKDEENLCAITDRLAPKVKEAKKEEKNGQSVDDILNIVKKLPKPIMHIFMAIMRFLDNTGLMPKAFSSVDTNYVTVMLSNLGSIKCDAVYHHLNNFGTNGIVITIGEMHKEVMLDENNNPIIRDVVNIGATLDERIADGFYFARSLKLIKHLFKNPHLLDKTLGEEIDFEF